MKESSSYSLRVNLEDYPLIFSHMTYLIVNVTCLNNLMNHVI